MSLRLNKTMAAAILGVAAIFWLDLLTPLGIGEWVLYLIPLVILSRRARPIWIFIYAGLIALLVVLGFISSPSPPGLPREFALVSRVVGIATLTIITSLLVQRQRAETALRENEERFREIFENAMIGVYRTTPDGRILIANPALVKMLGYSNFEELAQVSVTWDSICPTGFSRTEFLHQMEQDSRVVGLESAWKRKDGRALFTRESAWVVRDEQDDIQYFEGTVEDVTNRKTVEEARAAERNLLRNLINNLPDRIYLKDRHRRYLVDNIAHAQFLGASTPDDVVGKTIADFLPSAPAEHYDAVDRQIIESGQPLLNIEEVITQSDGTRRWSLTTKVPLHDAGGNVVGIVGISRDITDRKLAEEARRASEQQMQEMVNASPIPMFVIDKNHRITHWNRALEEYSSIKAEEVIGTTKAWRAFYSHERPCLADLLVDGATDKITEWYPGKYNRSRLIEDAFEATDFFPEMRGGTWLYFTAAPIRDTDGTIIGAVETLADITERKKAELALAEHRTQLDALMDNIPDAIYFKDRQSRFLRASKAQAVKFGVKDPADMVGKTDSDFFTQEHAQQAFADEQEVIRSGRPIIGKEEKETWPDGHVTWVSTTKEPLRDGQGQVIGTFGVSRDITDHRRAEEQLRVQLSALQAAANAIFMTDPQGQIVWVNAAFTVATGYALEEAIGRRLDFLASETAAPELIAGIQATITGGEVWHGELMNRRKNGTEFPGDLTVTPVRDEQGVLTHFVGIMQDVSQQHRLQEQLLQAQKMEAVGRLAGGVAHDFNNILTAVLGYSELLLQRSSPSDPLHRHADEIRKSAERAAALTQQLLAFSRRQPVQLRVLNLNELVADLNKMLRRLVGENIRMVTVCSPDLDHVRADAGQLQQIIMNLVVNARDAMPDGGTLTLQTANVQFDETYVRSYPEVAAGDYVMLAISDTGVGMTAEVKEHLFEPFFTTKGIGGGTGLGLAMCYGIVKQSGGHINVYSEPGQGTAFRIYLPRVTDTVERAPRHGPQAEIPRGTETILIVEDEPEVRALAVLVLRELGYRVIEAANGEEALQLTAVSDQQPIHLMVTDVVMPRLGGPHLAEALASRHPETKVLFISGYPDETITQHGTVPSNLAFLAKPFTPSALARRVREVLDGAKNSKSAAATTS
jgi:two-component system, cell cycle sensor histidine kinase and response regulator CckA